MKVLLTQPIREFIDFPPGLPDLGIGYLAVSLKEAGHEVIVRDWNVDSTNSEFERFLQKEKPEIIGIKVFTKDVFAAMQTLEVKSRVLPEAISILGGPHPSSAEVEELMDDY